MEYIQDKIFYHIQRLSPRTIPWNIGENIFFGKQKNYFFSFYDTFTYNLPKNWRNNLQLLNDVLNEYVIYARETIFEEIRIDNFPQLPSRQHCIWLIQHDVDCLNAWKQVLLKDNQPYQILELKCSGKLFMANQKFLSRHIGDFNLFREQAFKYWSGLDTKETSNDLEYLFQGFAKVDKIIDSCINKN